MQVQADEVSLASPRSGEDGGSVAKAPSVSGKDDALPRPDFRDERAVDEFSRRVAEHWLPEYALDAKRGYGVEGFRTNHRVDEFDAKWFMLGLDSGLVVSDGGGRLRAPRSQATETIFWECGPKDVRPRPINLWLEPVVTIGALARLHLLHGWPTPHLGLQSRDGAFDLVAYAHGAGDAVAIAGEVKNRRTRWRTSRARCWPLAAIRWRVSMAEIDASSTRCESGEPWGDAKRRYSGSSAQQA